jgi:hypothetical protein
MGIVALGYMWCRIVAAARAKKQADASSAAAMDAKLALAKFFAERIMPESGAHLARITAGADALMALPAEMF